MTKLDAHLDSLYALPLAEFTAARNALAKTVKGEEAARIKRLQKPSVVAWAVNQLYWHDRRTFDALMKAGRSLRDAQIAALKGRAADLRGATSAHRAALSAAIQSAQRQAATASAHPSPDALARMLEALSLAETTPEQSGRFTDVIQPAGFEALAGVSPVARPRAPARPAARSDASGADAPAHHAPRTTLRTAPTAAERARAAEAAALRKAAEAAVHAASRDLDRARAAEARAQAQVDAARQHLARAESDLDRASVQVKEARERLADAQRRLS